ncbi:MAG TPA: isoprenylcysteine carboxylmethyltransferase family protein [Terriglobales bacterium]|nr:isoprenylcysteine carboxylmethyltransferase family protein [Terriglobales bacterium]
MPHVDLGNVIGWLWMCLGVFWLAGWLGAKQSVRVQPTASRLVQLAFEIAAFYLMFAKQNLPQVLQARLLASSDATAWAGVILTFAGALFAVWARLTLGTNWSARVTIKAGHELVRSGPYALVRHPIYTGLLLMVLGTAIEIGRVCGFVALGLAFIGWFMKLRTEEALMEQQFGDQYTQYKHEVKALIPGVF